MSKRISTAIENIFILIRNTRIIRDKRLVLVCKGLGFKINLADDELLKTQYTIMKT